LTLGKKGCLFFPNSLGVTSDGAIGTGDPGELPAHGGRAQQGCPERPVAAPEATMAQRKRDIKDRFGWFHIVLPIVLAST
jgi:hypothetical protein